jgi:predicted GH43/DUF377 family glycosyl hydrolase
MSDRLDYHHCPDLFKRYENNPILTTDDLPYPANAIFNPGAIEHAGDTVLLNRVEGFDGFSHFTIARSKDGITNWEIDPKPTVMPDPDNHPEELWGIEDARIMYLEELEEYAVTYTSYSSGGPLISLILTKDFKTFRRQGPIMPPDDKDGSLFPRRFDGRWVLIHRPRGVNPSAKANIWFSYSPDLKHWGDHTVVMEARDGGWWDANKIGLGPQPVETNEGWLLIYHGVRRTASGSLYRVGLALLDLDDPRKVVCRCRGWVFGPQAEYERTGDVGYVTFPSGVVQDKESGTLRIYYGAADSTVALATATLSDVLEYINTYRC